MSMSTIRLSSAPDASTRVKGAHWGDAKGTFFKNPWPSHSGGVGFLKIAPTLYDIQRNKDPRVNDPNVVKSLIPQVVPDYGHGQPSHKLKATWLGHACYLLEMPSEKEGGPGVRVLLDPVFSSKCSPSRILGPSRYTREHTLS